MTFQPYHDSGFPHGFDQRISAADPSFANMALSAAASAQATMAMNWRNLWPAQFRCTDHGKISIPNAPIEKRSIPNVEVKCLPELLLLFGFQRSPVPQIVPKIVPATRRFGATRR